jgi:pyruvate dehydrogenase E1 component alpha subunit
MQSAAQTLAQKAFAAGIDCEQLDGNDVLAVRDAATRALERARSGGGPTLLEALTYRLSDHTTADDATRYRSAEELATQWKSEPILRLRNFLVSQGAWNKEREEQLHREVAERVRDTMKKYLETPAPEPAQMFRHLYARLPRAYAWQAAALEDEEERDAAHHPG